MSLTANSEISEITDIGDISEVDSGDVNVSVGSDTIEGEIVGVMCIAYTGCSLCKVKLTPPMVLLQNVQSVI